MVLNIIATVVVPFLCVFFPSVTQLCSCFIKLIVLAPLAHAFLLLPHTVSIFVFFQVYACSLLLPCILDEW